ncbi:MAG: gamma-glutamylcyclotransferase [Chlamydiia bacterium]|nr:gamma-glutamylcyclotransferase [Chlamydiia bacterium]
MRTRIAVYGSLLSGLGNFSVLGRHMPSNDARFIGYDTIQGFDLYAVSSFPGIKRSKELTNTVKVEIYDVSEKALASVRRLEGYRPNTHNTFYDEILTNTVDNGPVSAYLYMPPVQTRDLVSSGDWKAYLKNR